jgi:ATP-binding cassette subfamily B protein
MNTGELMSRMGEDIDNVWQAVSFGIRLVVENILFFILGLVVLLYFNWQLTLIVLVILVPITYVAIKLEKETMKNYGEISDQIASLNTTAQENIAGVRLVKAFSREKHEIMKFLSMNTKNYELNNENARITAKYYPPIELITSISQLVMICIGGYFVISDRMSVGTLVAYSGYIGNLIWPLREMGWLINLLAQNKASMAKIKAILETKAEITEKEYPTAADFKGNIEYRDVTFSYGNEEVLKEISFKANSGDTVAIMGTTGAGKTSILSLMSRFYDVENGEIMMEGTNIKDLSLNELRNSISLITQDTFLFSDTIRNNVSYGKKNATDEEILNALEISCADFIGDLADGLDTIIGERGVGLSGGQKQRISIARSILKDSPIMILDDATSALDMDTEYHLLKNLRAMQGTRTLFIIAHRISAVKNADQILFLEEGKIIEKGTHEELINLRGKYNEVYQEQFKDFDSLKEAN